MSAGMQRPNGAGALAPELRGSSLPPIGSAVTGTLLVVPYSKRCSLWR
jgi:hypothetical protein